MAAQSTKPLATTDMASLKKDNLTYVLTDARMGRYAAMCCLADPALRGELDELLRRFGLDRTLMILEAACCATPCRPLPQPGTT